jgi:tetratricopeptide (TPR) repeat protein
LTLTLGLAATIGSARRAHAQGTAPAAPPPQTAPMSEEARVHYDRGLAFYGAKDYRAAFAELEAGYAVDPRREFLFAEAQAQRLAGDCQRAVPLYQRFLATDPSPVQVNAAQVGLARCRWPPPRPRHHHRHCRPFRRCHRRRLGTATASVARCWPVG